MVDQSTYTKQYRYKFGYIFKQGDIVVPMNENEYFMPNAWIIDAVNLAVPTVYEWNIISARLDKGFTYCGNVDFDEARYNKAVVRKRNENGWIDTNTLPRLHAKRCSIVFKAALNNIKVGKTNHNNNINKT